MGVIKSGKVVIILAGRYAGRKAVVIKASEEGDGAMKFGHAVVAGIERYPRKIVKAMGKKKVEKRSQVKPFVKKINFAHLMPTRHKVDFDLKAIVSGDAALAPDAKKDTTKAIKALFEDKFKNPAAGKDGKKDGKAAMGAQYLFTKLRF